MGRTYKLSELAEASGIGGKAIHFYLREGVLPPARKVREKLALYDENHLRLLQLVKELQREKRLPLAEIGRLFREADYDARTLELNAVAGIYEMPPPAGSTSAPELSTELREELIRTELVEAPDGELSPEDRGIAAIVQAGRERGLPVSFFAELLEPVRAIATHENVAGLQAIDPEVTYAEGIKEARELDGIVNRFIAVAKLRELRRLFERGYEQAHTSLVLLRGRTYAPSEAFLRKHAIPEQLDALENEAEADGTPEARLRLGDAYQAIGRYPDALRCARRVLDEDPDHIGALLLELYARPPDEAIEVADRLLELRPRDSLVVASCALAHMVQASRPGGILSPLRWIKRSVRLLEESRALPPKKRRDQLVRLLIVGRTYTVLPASLGMIDDGIEALREGLALVDARSDRQLGLAFAGYGEVYRVNVHFFLGEAYELKGDPGAAQRSWQEVVLRDPGSAFGQRAFERMGPLPTGS